MNAVEEQRLWFWNNFTQECDRASVHAKDEPVRQRVEQLRIGIKWLHCAVWRIHSVRLGVEPLSNRPLHDELNHAATELLFHLAKFDRVFKESDFKFLTVAHDQGFVASLGGVQTTSYGLLCRELATHHFQTLKAHRPRLCPSVQGGTDSLIEMQAGFLQGRCFYNRPQPPDVGGLAADVSEADLAAVNKAFSAIDDFQFVAVASGGYQKNMRRPVDAAKLLGLSDRWEINRLVKKGKLIDNGIKGHGRLITVASIMGYAEMEGIPLNVPTDDDELNTLRNKPQKLRNISPRKKPAK